ncbi:MAG: hypothetical protein ACI9JN_002383, partial [Bacteroidia bacterium]
PQTQLTTVFGGLIIFVCVNIAWLFFRIDSIELIPGHVDALFNNIGTSSLEIGWPIWTMLGLFVLAEIMLYNKRIDSLLDNYRFPVRWIVYGSLIWCISAWAGVTNHPFIYFQF